MDQLDLRHIKPYEGDEKYIFVSYCHKDSEAVGKLLRLLESAGYRFWYDEGIDPGSDWPEVIAEHLDKCDSCIAVITPNALESHNCRREINFALRRKKPLLSIFLEPVELSLGMEMQLFSSQVIFKYQLPSDEAFMDKLRGAECLEGSMDTHAAGSLTASRRNTVPDLFAVTGAGVRSFRSSQQNLNNSSERLNREDQYERSTESRKAGRRRLITVSAVSAFILVVAAVIVAMILRNNSVSARTQEDPEPRLLMKNLDAETDANEAATYDPNESVVPEATPDDTDTRRMLIIPDVCGMEPQEAKAIIIAAGFVPEEGQPFYNKKVKFERVSRQEPAAYSSAYEGDTVYYSLCTIDTSNFPESLASSVKQFNGHSYLIIRGNYSWATAQYCCVSMGGHLATVNDIQEQIFLESINEDEAGLWLGGYRSINDPYGWQWITGEPWGYSNWGIGEPNGYSESGGEDKLAIWPRYWNDLVNESGEQDGFICEWEPGAIPDF